MASKTYYLNEGTIKILTINFSVPRGTDGRYVGVWFSVDLASQEMRYYFSFLSKLAIRATVNGKIYQSYMAGSGITRMINARWDDPSFGDPANPKDYTQTLTLSKLELNIGAGWNDPTDFITDADGNTPDSITFTFTPALSADATGELISHYPWRFKWRKLSDNCTPYRHVYGTQAGDEIKLLLPDCSWDVELKWLDANGTPFILPFSIDGGKNTAKMTDVGYYDGDRTIILRSPSLTPEEMKIAATIGESLRIAVKFKEAQGRAYPASTWVWAAVDDISIVNVEGEGTQVIEINLLR